MELTKKDRIFLINQYEILQRLDGEQADYYGKLIDILINGYEILYSELDQGLFDGMPEDDGDFVYDVLKIYRGIEKYKRGNPDDREVAEHLWGHFQGFDGNNEWAYRSFALFLIEKEKLFDEQMMYLNSTDGFNTHGPTLYKYRSMVDKWYELDRNLTTHEAVMQVLNAD